MELFKIDFEVRDNELDAQGIVNNANYFIYFAHARHKFFHSIGISFDQMAQQKQMLVLVSAHIQFKTPLYADDKFYVTCQPQLEGRIRLAFQQKIIRYSDEALIAEAHNVGVCLDGNNRNRPYVPEVFKKAVITSPA